MSWYRIDRCICHKRTFEEIKTFAEDQSFTTIEQLQVVKYCNCNCELCVPYVKKVLETGKTEFKINPSAS